MQEYANQHKKAEVGDTVIFQVVQYDERGVSQEHPKAETATGKIIKIDPITHSMTVEVKGQPLPYKVSPRHIVENKGQGETYTPLTNDQVADQWDKARSIRAIQENEESAGSNESST